MSATSVKAELQHLVEQENDERLVKVIKALLVAPARSALLKAKLSLRALQAEEDIRQGRVATREEQRSGQATGQATQPYS